MHHRLTPLLAPACLLSFAACSSGCVSASPAAGGSAESTVAAIEVVVG